MEQSKKLRMLGLAARAGKVITGLDMCEKAVRRGKAKLIVIAEDAADSTKRTPASAQAALLSMTVQETAHPQKEKQELGSTQFSTIQIPLFFPSRHSL